MSGASLRLAGSLGTVRTGLAQASSQSDDSVAARFVNNTNRAVSVLFALDDKRREYYARSRAVPAVLDAAVTDLGSRCVATLVDLHRTLLVAHERRLADLQRRAGGGDGNAQNQLRAILRDGPEPVLTLPNDLFLASHMDVFAPRGRVNFVRLLPRADFIRWADANTQQISPNDTDRVQVGDAVGDLGFEPISTTIIIIAIIASGTILGVLHYTAQIAADRVLVAKAKQAAAAANLQAEALRCRAARTCSPDQAEDALRHAREIERNALEPPPVRPGFFSEIAAGLKGLLVPALAIVAAIYLGPPILKMARGALDRRAAKEAS